MRKVFRWSGLFLSILALGVCGCSGSDADPMGTATVQFIDEAGKVLYPEKGGGLFAFSILPGESRQLIVWVTQSRDGGKTIVPLFNEKVTFTLLTPGNGGSVTMVKDRTDAGGRAVGLYTAGNNFQFDEVRATTEAGATAQLTILKIGSLVGMRISSLTASSPVAEGHLSTVTATVIDGSGNPIIGEGVTFTLATNESGGCFINVANACLPSVIVPSDVAGHAIAVYRAGGNSPTAQLYDTVRATLSNGFSNMVVITRSAGTIRTYTLTLTANPSSVTVPYGGGDFSVVLTATVKDPYGSPVSGVTVNMQAAPDGATVAAVTGNDGIAIGAYKVTSAKSGAIVFIGTVPTLNISTSTSVTVVEQPSP